MYKRQVYDFDRTIFKYDTYSEFFRYVCTRHHPWMWVLLIFPLVGFLLMLLMPWDVRLGDGYKRQPLHLYRQLSWRPSGGRAPKQNTLMQEMCIRDRVSAV